MTQEELKRLAKIAPDKMIEGKTDGGTLFWTVVGLPDFDIPERFQEPIDSVVFASIVSSLLAPWTAVPCGDEYVLVHIQAIQDIGLELFVEFYPDAEVIEDATRFASPLHAAEALHQNTEKA